MLKKIIFIILLTNMANSNIDKALPNESNSQINWDFIEELEDNDDVQSVYTNLKFGKN